MAVDFHTLNNGARTMGLITPAGGKYTMGYTPEQATLAGFGCI